MAAPVVNDDWFWQSRNHDGRFWPDRNRFGSGIWGWPSTISIGNLTIAGSGNGNVAIASNPVFISSGVWHWPGHINNSGWLWNDHMNNGQWGGSNHFGNSVWGWPSTISVGNLDVARSGSGNIAIVSNPIVIISSGLWFVPPDRNHDHDWFNHDDNGHGDNDHGDNNHGEAQVMYAEAAQAGGSDVEPMTINGGGSSEAPSKIEPAGSSEQPTVTVNGTLAVAQAPTESMQQPSDGATQPPAELDQPASDGNVALLSEGSGETPSDGTGAAPLDTAIEPAADAGAADLSYVAPNPSSVNGGADSVDAGLRRTRSRHRSQLRRTRSWHRSRLRRTGSRGRCGLRGSWIRRAGNGLRRARTELRGSRQRRTGTELRRTDLC